MTRSSGSRAARSARTVDELVAAEWNPEELFEPMLGQFHAGSLDPEALREATAAAQAVLDQQQAELEQRVAQAYAQGYEEGRHDGEIAEGLRLRTAVRAAEDALDALRTGESRWRGTIEENICALAIAVARHVIGREIAGDREALLELVRRAAAEFPLDQPLRVRLSAQDHALITGANSLEPGPEPPLVGREARWVVDPLVADGGCIVEGRERIVDGRVDNALERIYRRLTYTHA